MLGNCIIRNPSMKNGKLDKGSLCESLLFFEKTHLIIDNATLGTLINADFLDDLIAMLKAGYMSANFSPQSPALHTNNINGLREHFFTVIKLGGDQKHPNMRNPELLESQLLRLSDNKDRAKKQYRQLAKLITFEDIADHNLPRLARDDIADPLIAKEVARLAIRGFGVPEEEIAFSKIDVLPLNDNKFVITTDIDFDKIRKYVPEDEKATFGQNHLFPAISDARFDIGIAATHNAAFVGNEKNEAILNLIFQRILGARFNAKNAPRKIYDFISVATPSVREVINSGERSPTDFIKLMENSDSFRRWLNRQNPSADLVTEMLREKSNTGWLETLPAKTMRFGLFTGLGMLAEPFAPGASVAFDAADTFIFERLGVSWRPHYFVENNLRGFLEKNI